MDDKLVKWAAELQSLAQAGLGHAQFLGRAGDIQAFRHLYEILQFKFEENL